MITITRPHAWLLSILVLMLLPFESRAEIELFLVGDFYGGSANSYAFDISSDGMVVTGQSGSELGTIGYRWTADGEMTQIGFVPYSEGSYSRPSAVSADGSTIVGWSANLAFRWTYETGIVSLGDLPGGMHGSSALDVSADGNMVVGNGRVDFLDVGAFLWTPAHGMQSLGDAYGELDGYDSYARAISDDGSVIVGSADFERPDGPRKEEAVIWTEAGIQSIHPNGDPGYSLGFEVSADGSIVYGGINHGINHYGLLVWTPEEGTRELPYPGSFVNCSPSGWFLVGEGIPEAWLWDQANGKRVLSDLLRRHGVELPETFRFTSLDAMSVDHRALCGSGYHADTGIPEGFVIYNFTLPGDVEGDMNGDGTVDPLDWKPLQYCTKGPGATAKGICTLADMDGDGDVDLRDIAIHYQPHVVPGCLLRADLTGDCVVDELDYRRFWRCIYPYGGPGGPNPNDCSWGDLDGDADVDLRDFAEFQRLYADPATN